MQVLCLPLNREWHFDKSPTIAQMATKIARDLNVFEHSVFFIHPHSSDIVTEPVHGMRVCIRIEVCERHRERHLVPAESSSPVVASSVTRSDQ